MMPVAAALPIFAAASLAPAVLIALGAAFGGVWAWAALFSVTLFVVAADRLSDRILPRTSAGADALPVLLALVHLPLFFAGVWAIAAAPWEGPGARAALALALGLYAGQVFNSNAHELIHSAGRWRRRLGVAVYTILLFGHHASAHPKVHHVHVATDGDPNSARPGESYWAYLPRAWIGSFRAGWRAETRQRRGRGGLHPYAVYLGGGIAALALSFALAGPAGLATHIGLALYATAQLLLSDYVQHYGLRRALRPDGTREPAGPQHAWNAPHWYSGAMMLNAPRHSDHHVRPAARFGDLRLDAGTMPMLPRSLPVMGAVALVPPLWRRMMDRRAARWRGKALPEQAAAAAPHGQRAADLREFGHAIPDRDSASVP